MHMELFHPLVMLPSGGHMLQLGHWLCLMGYCIGHTHHAGVADFGTCAVCWGTWIGRH